MHFKEKLIKGTPSNFSDTLFNETFGGNVEGYRNLGKWICVRVEFSNFSSKRKKNVLENPTLKKVSTDGIK